MPQINRYQPTIIDNNNPTTTQLLEDIKSIVSLQLGAMNERYIYVSPVTVILDSSNLQQQFDSSCWYDIKIVLVGSPTSDVVVALNMIANNISTHNHIRLNTSQTEIIFKGLNLNNVSVLASTISTYSVYITFIGYKGYVEPGLIK